jgi:hypothetical protein
MICPETILLNEGRNTVFRIGKWKNWKQQIKGKMVFGWVGVRSELENEYWVYNVLSDEDPD